MTFERFQDTGEFGTGEHNELLLRQLNSAELFDALNAQRWIDTFRVEKDGLLDIQATADKVGIPVDWEMPLFGIRPDPSSGMLTGLAKDSTGQPLGVHINPSYPVDEHALTFGHELGHLFLETAAGILQGGSNRASEDFSEFFGKQMVLPVDKLAAIDRVTESVLADLMERFTVDHVMVLHQLMFAGKMPRRIIIDTANGDAPNPLYSNKVGRRVVCLDCSLGAPHAHETTPANTPVYDFTHQKWLWSTPFVPCKIPTPALDLHIEINKLYGRWSEADEALVPEARRREAETQRSLRQKFPYLALEDL